MATVLIPPAKRTDKLHAVAEPCMFVGYADYSKAWRFLRFLASGSVEVVESADATFFENKTVPMPARCKLGVTRVNDSDRSHRYGLITIPDEPIDDGPYNSDEEYEVVVPDGDAEAEQDYSSVDDAAGDEPSTPGHSSGGGASASDADGQAGHGSTVMDDGSDGSDASDTSDTVDDAANTGAEPMFGGGRWPDRERRVPDRLEPSQASGFRVSPGWATTLVHYSTLGLLQREGPQT